MPAEQLTVTALQWPAALEPAANRDALGGFHGSADLVVLPEAFARDFGPVTDPLGPYAEEQGGAFDIALTALAGRTGGAVVAGMFESSGDPERPHNTLLVRGSCHAAYRKVHLYDSFGYRESDRLTAGPWKPTVVEIGGWQVGLLTCYDLRFPELARDLVTAGAEALVVPAAWVPGRTPEEHARKVDHWRTLVRARAIENVSWVVAVGQPAPRYTGHSMVVDPNGTVVAEAGADRTELSAVLERSTLIEARATNPSLTNRVH
ncbi:nitrilase-related carbon-nitrogen hydrolase [Nocardioides cavernaquae]|uniref:Hydrolase n=1 Tax=Nocardioides cavernaquae TaxID=2321396 RepID=A0A3A5H5A8_9ACTN|nr:nitrilase-related carbon-nitrogen hydrolase [Nocardioides cavernaquae]RJS45886.1 hydrolase [Nocardioides cavernaquae]